MKKMPRKKAKQTKKGQKKGGIEPLKRLNNWLRFSVFAADGIAVLSWIIFKYQLIYLVAIVFLVLIARIGALLFITQKVKTKNGAKCM